MKILKLCFLFFISSCFMLSAQKRVQVKGLVINPSTLEEKKHPEVTITINKETKIPNKKGKFKIKAFEGDTLAVTSKDFTNLKYIIPKNTSKALVVLNEFKGLIKFFGKKEQIKNHLEKAIEDFNKLPMIIDQYPIYPGCETVDSKSIAKCLNRSLNHHIRRKFNTDIANELGLSPGKKRISILFAIDKRGEIKDIEIKAPHPRLEKEALRIIKEVPKMQPALRKNKAVELKYGLPIVFRVE